MFSLLKEFKWFVFVHAIERAVLRGGDFQRHFAITEVRAKIGSYRGDKFRRRFVAHENSGNSVQDFGSVAAAVSRCGFANSRVSISARDCHLRKSIRQRAISKTDFNPGVAFVPTA